MRHRIHDGPAPTSDPTPPAVSEAMREAVARDGISRGRIEAAMRNRIRVDASGLIAGIASYYLDGFEVASADVQALYASEIARLTGERERWEACALACELRLAAAEAETARLRAALEDTRAAADQLVPVCIAEGDNKAAGALQFVSGFISDRLAALTSQEKTDV